jgi:FtsZ-binding cell division protein ZapB
MGTENEHAKLTEALKQLLEEKSSTIVPAIVPAIPQTHTQQFLQDLYVVCLCAVTGKQIKMQNTVEVQRAVWAEVNAEGIERMLATLHTQGQIITSKLSREQQAAVTSAASFLPEELRYLQFYYHCLPTAIRAFASLISLDKMQEQMRAYLEKKERDGKIAITTAMSLQLAADCLKFEDDEKEREAEKERKNVEKQQREANKQKKKKKKGKGQGSWDGKQMNRGQTQPNMQSGSLYRFFCALCSSCFTKKIEGKALLFWYCIRMERTGAIAHVIGTCTIKAQAIQSYNCALTRIFNLSCVSLYSFSPPRPPTLLTLAATALQRNTASSLANYPLPAGFSLSRRCPLPGLYNERFDCCVNAPLQLLAHVACYGGDQHSGDVKMFSGVDERLSSSSGESTSNIQLPFTETLMTIVQGLQVISCEACEQLLRSLLFAVRPFPSFCPLFPIFSYPQSISLK